MSVEGLTYYDSFITEEEESGLVRFIESQQWNTALKRRTQHYGHLYKYTHSSTSQDNPVPPVPDVFLQLYQRIVYFVKLKSIDLTKLQVIVNEYLPGVGISAHIDDPRQFGEWVCGVSLLSATEMNFSGEGRSVDVNLKRRSLYVMEKESRYRYTHEIKPRKSDNGIKREKRISITFRYLN